MIAVPRGWQPSPLCRAEVERLSVNAIWQPIDSTSLSGAHWFDGAALQRLPAAGLPSAEDAPTLLSAADIPALRIEGRAIIAATGKAADGIVSRHINRPISQAMTRLVLRLPGARPWHATLAAALIGAAMLAALLFGGATGLLIGAALFQLASIVDGVDGEMARATFRTSDRGAMLDSLTDAATNLAFIGGVSFNLYASGNHAAAMAGLAGFAALALGSALLAIIARRAGGAFTFDALKHRFRQNPSGFKQMLIWLTMRDFYAFAACLAILAGLATPLLYLFAAVAIIWLIVLCWTMAGTIRRIGRAGN